MLPTGRQRLMAVGVLLVYLGSLPLLLTLWVGLAHSRFPELNSRNDLSRVGTVSTTILLLLVVVAVIVVVASLIAIVFSPKGARVPWIGLAATIAIWAVSVATMVEPAPVIGG